MYYFVTFCAQDQDMGANPMWHSSVLLSRCENGQPMEVLHNWGFYPMPTPENSGWFNLLSATVFNSNHGFLMEEHVRFYDKGRGLHGKTFEITEEKAQLLERLVADIIKNQKDAIDEVVNSQGIKGKDKGIKFYPQEDYSSLLFQIESIKAKEKGRECRLKPFETKVSIGWYGPSTIGSKNCKTMAIFLLSHVLSDEQISQLTENDNHPTLPRFSGKMEDIYLYSTGPTRKHRKASGEIAHFRDARKDEDVKLYWTLPPQELETIYNGSEKLLRLDEEYCDRIKPKIKQLQSLEWLFRDAVVPEVCKSRQCWIIQMLMDCYKSLSILNEKPAIKKQEGLLAWAFTYFAPKNEEEKRVDELLNLIYFAVVDGHLPSIEEEDEDDLETLMTYLPVETKKKICSILGRSYWETNELAVLEENAASI